MVDNMSLLTMEFFLILNQEWLNLKIVVVIYEQLYIYLINDDDYDDDREIYYITNNNIYLIHSNIIIQ
jgi:hypothetical protein